MRGRKRHRKKAAKRLAGFRALLQRRFSGKLLNSPVYITGCFSSGLLIGTSVGWLRPLLRARGSAALDTARDSS